MLARCIRNWNQFLLGMPMLSDVECTVRLRPIWHDDPPCVIVRAHDQERKITLDQTQSVYFAYRSSGPQTLTIDFVNKQNTDTIIEQGLDKAVEIEAIDFFGISDPRFVWQGRYRPRYPEPWYSQQVARGQTPREELINIERLGWNGTWTLDFDLPIFTWIHRVQNLGWIYT